MSATAYIGISGWKYAGWRGVFYPPKLPQRGELSFAAGQLNSIEINGTHYSLQRPEYFQQWANETPGDFVFSVKGSRFITHMKKLRNIEDALANFCAQGILELGPKLGPILWQFPPQFTFDKERLAKFFAMLPRTHAQMARLARRHGPKLEGRSSIKHGAGLSKMSVRHCVEIRHESFVDPEFIELLRRFNVGLVVADTVSWPLLMDVTADFVYCRLHGSEQLYASGYGSKSLDIWAKRVTGWMAGRDCTTGRFASSVHSPRRSSRDVYVYFDNDMKVRAPFDALALRSKVDRLLEAIA